MRHALLARRAALLVGPVLLLAACGDAANGPASPRTSEMVQLSQAPVDAVPYVVSRPSAPPPEAEKDEALTEEAQAEATAEASATTPSAPAVTLAPAAPAAAPPPPQPAQPQPAGDVPQN